MAHYARWYRGAKLDRPVAILDGRKKHSLYNTWIMMRARCYTPGATGFAYYGGRGIRVCPRWSDFWAFVEDMGPKPSESHTLDRKQSNGNYTPNNCRWATKIEQRHNRS